MSTTAGHRPEPHRGSPRGNRFIHLACHNRRHTR